MFLVLVVLSVWQLGRLSAQSVFPPPEARPKIHAAQIADGKIRIDGVLDDPDWQKAAPTRSFVQIDPGQGALPSFDTVVRVLFDRKHLYVGAVCYDSAGHAGIRAAELRRDFEYTTNDVFSVSLDPFQDHRSCTTFQVNPYGAQRDFQVTDGQFFNREWDARWTARTTVNDSAWTVEIALPWETLRYPAQDTIWGVNFLRNIRRNNEVTGWSPWPRVYSPYRMDYAGELTGLRPPPPSRNLTVQPYLLVESRSDDRSADALQEYSNDLGSEIKWAPGSNTVLDITLNTDFAQADADREVINLKRFSVFFPEKRQFFLESAHLFDIGYTSSVKPFFSRRIGLDEFGRPLPIDGGARLVHQAPDQGIAALLIRQGGKDEIPASWFTVGRWQRNVGGRSRLGGLVTYRHDAAQANRKAVHNATFTLDGFWRLSKTLTANALVSGSLTEGEVGDGINAQLWIFNNATWGFIGHFQSLISPEYKAAAGFVSRPNLIETSPFLQLDLRPRWLPSPVRALTPEVSAFLFHRASDGKFQEGTLTVKPISLQFQSSATIAAFLEPNWQRLDSLGVRSFMPFGVALAPGDYNTLRAGLSLASDQSRSIAADLTASTGGFFDGVLHTLGAGAKISPSPHLTLRLQYELNRATKLGPAATDKTTHLFGPRVRLALNPRVHLTTFYQYNSLLQRSTWNIRFSYEFAPLSYLYLIYNDSRFVNTGAISVTPPAEQQIILKFSYQFQI